MSSSVAMATVKAPLAWMLAKVLRVSRMEMATAGGTELQMPPQATFMALGVPSWP